MRAASASRPGRALIYCTAGLFLLGGCGGKPLVRVAVPFDPVQARKRLEPGTTQIAGSALLWLSTGGVISCAGETATLYPATAYAREWARLTYDTVEPGKATPQGFAYRPKDEDAANGGVVVDPSFLEIGHTVPCDGDGHFHFERVGDGEFYLVARIVWQPHIWDEHHFFYGNRYHSREGTVMKKIRVHGGEKVTASLRWSVPNSRYNLW